jgi:hypothetical protein
MKLSYFIQSQPWGSGKSTVEESSRPGFWWLCHNCCVSQASHLVLLDLMCLFGVLRCWTGWAPGTLCIQSYGDSPPHHLPCTVLILFVGANKVSTIIRFVWSPWGRVVKWLARFSQLGGSRVHTQPLTSVLTFSGFSLHRSCCHSGAGPVVGRKGCWRWEALFKGSLPLGWMAGGVSALETRRSYWHGHLHLSSLFFSSLRQALQEPARTQLSLCSHPPSQRGGGWSPRPGDPVPT